MRLLAPPPRPCTGRCSAPSTRPTPSFSRVLPRGASALGSLSRSPLRALQQLPGCCTRRCCCCCCRGNCSPGTAPGRLPAPPLPHPSDAPLASSPPASCPLPTRLPILLCTGSPVPTHLVLGTLPSPAAPAPLRCSGVGRCLVPGPAPR